MSRKKLGGDLEMKMKKGLLMVVLLLALSSIMAAMSYTSAKVTSAMTGTVTNTNNALLALKESKSHNAAFNQDGVLVIDFNKGDGNKSYGLQKHSDYVWDKLFSIANNSENDVDVTIKTENNSPGVKIEVKIGGHWTPINTTEGFIIKKLKASPGNSGNNDVAIDVRVIVDKGASLANFNPNLIVEGSLSK